MELKGTAAKLAKLIAEQGTYEYDGVKWLPVLYAVIAEELGVHENTIKKIAAKPPFKRRAKVIDIDGKKTRATLIRIGTEKTESDHVFSLRKIWVTGLIYFNSTFAEAETKRVEWLKNQGADPKFYERIEYKITKAKKDAKDLDKLKAGEKISLHVKQGRVMGLLRGVVQALGEDAPNTLYALLTYDGWKAFAAFIKAAEREKHHAHWPRLDWIVKHPDIALDAYIDIRQAGQKLSLKEVARLNAKIAKLAAKPASEPAG